jgi:hypothetical protein
MRRLSTDSTGSTSWAETAAGRHTHRQATTSPIMANKAANHPNLNVP